MDQLLKRVADKVQGITQTQHQTPDTAQRPAGQTGSGAATPTGSGSSDLGKSRLPLPDVVLQAIDKYVDGLAPEISPVITKESKAFQTQTLDSLEAHLKEAFRGVFKGDFSAFHSNRELDHLASSRSVDLAGPAVPGPDAYGQRGLPLLSSPSGAGNHTTSTSSDVGLVGDREIAQKERSIFEDALGKVSAFAQTQGGSSSFGNQLQGAMSNIAQHIDKVKADPDEKARQIGPELRSKVGELLQRQHAPLADKMTTAALIQIKRWLRGNTSARDLGEGVRGDIGNLVSGFFNKSSISSSDSRSAYSYQQDGSESGAANTNNAAPDGSPHGVAGILSKKLSKGLTNVRASTRDDFRSTLSAIEQALFNELPDSFKGPLSKVFGGNPFESNLISTSGSQGGANRGIDLFDELGDKILKVVERVQRSLRDRVLEVVGGGHRRLEDRAWRQVQDTVVARVRKFVPGVKVDVEQENETQGGAPHQQQQYYQQQQQQQPQHQPQHQPSGGKQPVQPQNAPYGSGAQGQAAGQQHQYQQQHQPSSAVQHGQHQNPAYVGGAQTQGPGQQQQYQQQHQPSQYQQQQPPSGGVPSFQHQNPPYGAGSQEHQYAAPSHHDNPAYSSGSQHQSIGWPAPTNHNAEPATPGGGWQPSLYQQGRGNVSAPTYQSSASWQNSPYESSARHLGHLGSDQRPSSQWQVPSPAPAPASHAPSNAQWPTPNGPPHEGGQSYQSYENPGWQDAPPQYEALGPYGDDDAQGQLSGAPGVDASWHGGFDPNLHR